ncbi:hypothetical protein TNCV_3621141 [Trichonephila clavipes]|nr:hypothetical protein TNCV_3621141 [Trichonephila clavipes]
MGINRVSNIEEAVSRKPCASRTKIPEDRKPSKQPAPFPNTGTDATEEQDYDEELFTPGNKGAMGPLDDRSAPANEWLHYRDS